MATHKKSKRDGVSLAGWLFADLFLGLAMIFLASAPSSPPPLVPTPFIETSTLTNTPFFTRLPTTVTTSGNIKKDQTPVPTATKAPIGLQKPQCYNLELEGTSVEDGSERDQIIRQLNKNMPNDSSVRVGLLLVWGHGKDIYQGRQLALRVSKIIQEQFPLSFAGANQKTMGFDVGAYKHVQVEVYLFTDSKWEGINPAPCEYNN